MFHECEMGREALQHLVDKVVCVRVCISLRFLVNSLESFPTTVTQFIAREGSQIRKE